MSNQDQITSELALLPNLKYLQDENIRYYMLGVRDPQNVKCFCSISRPNVDGYKLSIHHFKCLAELIKMAHHKLKSIQNWPSYEVKSV